MTEETATQILARVQEVLDIAQLGAADMRSITSGRRRAGLANVITFGRMVTWVLVPSRMIT